MAEYESFIASIQEKEQKWDNRLKPSSQKQPTTVSLARFNPNIADSVIFCRLGLPGWMARNILRYRSKGGKFHKAEDFRKIYGMTEKQYQTLLPYIHITPEDTETRTVQYTALLQAMTAPLLSELHRKNIRLGPLST